MHRRQVIAGIGSGGLAGLAGCTDVLTSETTLESTVLDEEWGKIVEFSAGDENIADVHFRRYSMAPEGGYNFRARFRKYSADLEWSDVRFVLDFEDHPPEEPYVYLRGDESMPDVTIDRQIRTGSTIVSIDADETPHLSLLHLLAVHTFGIDAFITTELAVDLDLTLVENGYTETEYVGAHSFHLELNPEEVEEE